MRELHGDIEISLDQATTIARAMQAVAEADGVHQREEEMINSFYQSCAEASGSPTSTLTAPYDGAAALTSLGSHDHALALVKSCYLLALADGQISKAEEARIGEIAADVGVDDAARAQCARDAKLYLLRQFEGVSVFKATAWDIGRKLGLDDATLEKALA